MRCLRHAPGLAAQTKDSRFARTLHRLAEIVIDIPPLRQRVGDAALLAHAFARRFAQEQNRGSLGLAEDTVRAVEAHSWPGNVRELASCIKRASIMADGSQITADDLGLKAAAEEEGANPFDLRAARDAAERRTVIAALGRAMATSPRRLICWASLADALRSDASPWAEVTCTAVATHHCPDAHAA